MTSLPETTSFDCFYQNGNFSFDQDVNFSFDEDGNFGFDSKEETLPGNVSDLSTHTRRHRCTVDWKLVIILYQF